MKKLVEAQNMRMAFSNNHNHSLLKKKSNYLTRTESNNNSINWHWHINKESNIKNDHHLNSNKKYDILKIEESDQNRLNSSSLNNNIKNGNENNQLSSPSLSRINTPK